MKKNAIRQKQLIQIKDVPYVYVDSDLFSGTLEEVSSNILNLRRVLERAYIDREVGQAKMNVTFFSKYKPIEYTPLEQYEVIKLAFGRDYDGVDIELDVFRVESDAEFEERLRKLDESEKKRKESAKKATETKKMKKMESELKQLAMLKAKYEL